MPPRPPSPPCRQEASVAEPPPLRGPWHWIWSHAAPRDRLVLALGVAAALTSGVWTARACTAVSLGLGAFASTPVDAAALSAAAQDLQWLAFGLYILEAVAALAFERLAAQFTVAFCSQPQWRGQRDATTNGDCHAGDSSKRARARDTRKVDRALRFDAAPALLACVRNAALLVSAPLGSALALARSDSDFALVLPLVAAPLVLFGWFSILHPPTTAIPNPTPGINRQFATYELAELRAIAAHNAQDMAGAVHSERALASGDYQAVEACLTVFPNSAVLGLVWITAVQVLFVWAWAATRPYGAMRPRDAFEMTGGVLLATAALPLFEMHRRTIQRAMAVLATSDDTDRSCEGASRSSTTTTSEATSVFNVLRMLQPDRTLLSIAMFAAAASGVGNTHLAAFSATTAASLVTEYTLCGAEHATYNGTEQSRACQDVHALAWLDSTQLYGLAAGVAASALLCFACCRVLGAKVYRRAASLHVAAACHQRVRDFESSGNGADAFYVAHESIPSDVSAVCRRLGVVLLALSTSLCAFAAVTTAGPWGTTAPLLLPSALLVAVEATNYTQRRRGASSLDTLPGAMAGFAAFARTMIAALAFQSGQLIGDDSIPAFVDVVRPVALLSLALVATRVSLSQADALVDDLQRTADACSAILALGVDAATTQDTRARRRPEGTIQFQNVCFQDPMYKSASPLKQLSLTIGAGETVVFCGPRGGGHEHLVALLERFYDPTSGDVLLDGENLRDVDVTWLRSQVGLLEAEPMLFEGSIADNIAVGSRRLATTHEVERAAKATGAHHAIMETLAQGYDTKVVAAETSHELFGITTRLPYSDRRMMSVPTNDDGAASMDCHHSIALARVAFKDPPVLLLNESTRDLGWKSLQVVRRGIEALATRKRTTIVIGLDLPRALLESADRIYVLRDGAIAEQGTHAELLASECELCRSLVGK